MKARTKTSAKVRSSKNDDKAAVLSAWHRVDCKTREAMRRTSFSEFIERIEVSHYKTIISFILIIPRIIQYFVYNFHRRDI